MKASALLRSPVVVVSGGFISVFTGPPCPYSESGQKNVVLAADFASCHNTQYVCEANWQKIVHTTLVVPAVSLGPYGRTD